MIPPAPFSPILRRTLLGSLLLAGLPLAVLLSARPVAGQTGHLTPPIMNDPYWLHITPAAGGLLVSRPGDAGGIMASLQLEVSHMLPIGMGLAGGYMFPGDDPAQAPDGPFLEAIFVYRFHLRAGGRVSPYAGPLAGGIRDDTGEISELRGFFGGRAGIDIPIPGAWPTIRIEAAYRHLSEAAGRGTTDTALLALGGRWSVPLTP